MKILHVINSLELGGAEKLVSDLLPRLNRMQRVEVSLLLLNDKEIFFENILAQKNIRIFKSKYKLRDPRQIFFIRKILKQERFDLVHVHLFPAQYWVALAVRGLSVKPKLVFTEHSTFNRRRNKIFLKQIDSYIYKKYDSIVTISSEVDEHLAQWIGKSAKMVQIENGIDLSTINQARAYKKHEIHSDFDDETILISMIARFVEAKDQKTLIDAVADLPANVKLILAGDGVTRQQMVEYIESKSLENKVFCLGSRKDVPQLLRTSDIVVLSSKYEGLSLASIEGMASGKPFVASNVPGIKEIVGGYGLLFEQGNSQQLRDILRELIENKELQTEVIEKCLARSLEFSVEKTAKEHINLYNTLVDNIEV